MGGNGRPYRIYLAEDNPGDVYLVKESLRQALLSFDLTVFDDGEQAWKRFLTVAESSPEEHPHMLLLDLNLPKSDGGEVLRKLRSTDPWTNLPVVVLTSSESPADRAMASKYNAGYFRKPNDLDCFLELGPYLRNLLLNSGTP